MLKKNLKELLQTEDAHLQKLNTIVEQAIVEEKMISEKLMQFEDQHPPLSSRIADKVASFGGVGNSSHCSLFLCCFG